MSVDDYIQQLTRQRFFAAETETGSVRWYINWYRTEAPAKRRWFRVTGFVTLLLSISLPFIVAMAPETSKTEVATVIAWLIAVAGAASGFFQWNKTWQNYLETQFKLEWLLMEWQLGVATYAGKTDEASLIKVQELSFALVSAARAAIADETQSYFEEVKFPPVHGEQV